MYLSCAKFFILRQFRQFRPLGESLFESSHKIFENDFFTEKHNDRIPLPMPRIINAGKNILKVPLKKV